MWLTKRARPASGILAEWSPGHSQYRPGQIRWEDAAAIRLDTSVRKSAHSPIRQRPGQCRYCDLPAGQDLIPSPLEQQPQVEPRASRATALFPAKGRSAGATVHQPDRHRSLPGSLSRAVDERARPARWQGHGHQIEPRRAIDSMRPHARRTWLNRLNTAVAQRSLPHVSAEPAVPTVHRPAGSCRPDFLPNRPESERRERLARLWQRRLRL